MNLGGGMRRYKQLLELDESGTGSCQRQKMKKPLRNIREPREKLRRPEGNSERSSRWLVPEARDTRSGERNVKDSTTERKEG